MTRLGVAAVVMEMTRGVLWEEEGRARRQNGAVISNAILNAIPPRIRDDGAATSALTTKVLAAPARDLDDEEGSDSMGRSTIGGTIGGGASDSSAIAPVRKDSSTHDREYEERSSANISFPSMHRQRYQPSRESSCPNSTASSEFRSVSAGKERNRSTRIHPTLVHARRTQHTHATHSLAPHDQDDLPGLRFSYSSSTQTQAETPPQTPVDRSSNSLDVGFDDIRVVVAAPISGVEAMDALVDGMDGSDDDDLYKKLSFLSQGLGPSVPKKPSKSPTVKNHHRSIRATPSQTAARYKARRGTSTDGDAIIGG